MKALLILLLVTIIFSQSTISEYELKDFNKKLKLYVNSLLIKKQPQEGNQKLELPLIGNAKYISNVVPFSKLIYTLGKENYPKEVKGLIGKAKTSSPLYIINIEYSKFDEENKEFNEYIGVAFNFKEHVFYGFLNSHIIENDNPSDGNTIREGYENMGPQCWGECTEEELKMIEEFKKKQKEEEEKKKKLILEAYISKSRKEMKKVIDSLI